jgi:hypothetical protein
VPTYTYRVNDTGEIQEHILRMTEKDAFTANHPELEPVILHTIPLCDPVRIGVRRIPTGFREVLTRIKKANPGSDINV